MPAQDTPARYGLVTRLFHWIMAYLLLWQFLMAIAWILFEEGAVTTTLGKMGPGHTTVGFLVFALILPRLVWALANRGHRPPADPTLAGRMAKAVHGIFYALMFAVPTLALLRAYGSGKGFALFGQQIVPATGVKAAALMEPANLLHSPLAWLLAVLIAGHIAMALVHGVVFKDGTLRRMAGR